MYDQFGWPGSQPIHITNSEYGGDPDIDVVFVTERLLKDRQALHPHEVDREFGYNYIWREKGGVVVVSGYGLHELSIAANAAKALFWPRVRMLGGRIPLRTFSIGVHQQLERLARLPADYRSDPDEYQKYENGRAKFDAFVEWARGVVPPDEFPSSEELEPLIRANEIISEALDRG